MIRVVFLSAALLGACIYVKAPAEDDDADGGIGGVRDAAADGAASAATEGGAGGGGEGGGSSGSPASPSDPDSGGGGQTGTPALVGVGYGGLRVLSTDGGRSWQQTAVEAEGGGDDSNLLRAVAYANGMWLAVGWAATTSTDGRTWTPLRRINDAQGVTWEGARPCGLVEGLTSDGQAFYAVCAPWEQPAHIFRSTDANTWEDLAEIGDVGGHPAADYRAGTFYVYGDRGVSFRSTDARSWREDGALPRATFCAGEWRTRDACGGSSWFDGAYFRSEWQSKILRSEDGERFSVAHDDSSNNTLYQPRAIAAGFVP